MHASYDGKDKIPIVETYINICNAYTFQNMHEAALDYAEGGIQASQRIIDVMIAKFQDQSLTQNERDALSKHYYHIVNLNMLAFKTRGQILEKFKRFDEAIESYQMAKQVVESNYGHSDKMYIELANAINGAKLRTKYFQNSNLPLGGNRAAI